MRDQLRKEREEVSEADPDGSASNGAEAEASTDGADGDAATPTDAEPATEQAEAEDPLVAACRERDEYLDLARRTQADFENYRKRAAKDVAAAGNRARVGLIRELLPIVDNLERALASAAEADAGLAEGVKLVHSELQGVLQRAGVVTIDPAGDPFDPTVHEALSTREQEGSEAGVVLDVVEKGYRANETVIRPARVIVAS